MFRIMRPSLASSSTRAFSEEEDVEEVISMICGWRWPTGADQGLVTVSHPDGSAWAVGARGAASSSIGNRHLENWPVVCAETGAADINEKTSTIPESVYLIIGRLHIALLVSASGTIDPRSNRDIPSANQVSRCSDLTWEL
jgi:hypothetical protein